MDKLAVAREPSLDLLQPLWTSPASSPPSVITEVDDILGIRLISVIHNVLMVICCHSSTAGATVCDHTCCSRKEISSAECLQTRQRYSSLQQLASWLAGKGLGVTHCRKQARRLLVYLAPGACACAAVYPAQKSSPQVSLARPASALHFVASSLRSS